MLMLAMTLACTELPVVRVDRDNVVIRESARVVITEEFILDEDSNGVIHVVGDNITVDFTDQILRGAAAGTDPDRYLGTGVRISGSNIMINGGRFSGFKVAIHATNADGLTLYGVDVSDNFRQRLRSTPQAEAAEDWLWPHNNDDGEWRTMYGAGICVEHSNEITIRNVRARNVQNGILLSNINHSKVYDNDCSFLSGWGLAMWRCSHNTIARNAFDFCIRGYSHGVYNRGQDSAGILMFEQCSHNIVAENSATHGGDGIFAFAGREALGEANRVDDADFYVRRGNNRNIFLKNNLSYAAAHGLELTFSFDNLIGENTFHGNAICGIWGGFSQGSIIVYNSFTANGDMPYGSERGGINIEHGYNTAIYGNRFKDNACGVFFWSRDHTTLLETPWAKANHRGCTENYIGSNTFERDRIAIQLRRADSTRLYGNEMTDVGSQLDADEHSLAAMLEGIPATVSTPRLELPGLSRPIGKRNHLAGRENIIMTEWGPYDWASPLLHMHERGGHQHVYRVLGVEQTMIRDVRTDDTVELQYDRDTATVMLSPRIAGRATPYRVEAILQDDVLTATGVLIPAQWHVRAFSWETDPRDKVDQWRMEALRESSSVSFTVEELKLNYRHAGPSQLAAAPQHVRDADLPRDRFGTIATTQLTFPTGRWLIRTVSDDGIRVWLDETIVIDDWTWHAPKEHLYEFEIAEEREIAIRVEHFELDGYAVLSLEIERIE